MNALRLNTGFNTKLFSANTGLPFEAIEPSIKLLIDRGMLEQTGMNIKPTSQGRRFLNEMLEAF